MPLRVSTKAIELLDLLVGEQRLHRRHQRHRVDEARVVEVRALPVVRVPARLLREVGAGALGAEQVRRLVAAVEVARLRDLRVEEVERLAHVLRPRVAGVADVAAVRGEEVAALDGAGSESGAQSADGRRVEGVDRQPDDDRTTTVKNASRPPRPAISGVISIRSCGWRDQPRGTCAASSCARRALVAPCAQPVTGGGAIASATLQRLAPPALGRVR